MTGVPPNVEGMWVKWETFRVLEPLEIELQQISDAGWTVFSVMNRSPENGGAWGSDKGTLWIIAYKY